MKKILFLGTMLIALITFSALAIDQNAGAAEEGAKSPRIILSNDDCTVDLKSLYGNYVFVDFWSSADASSRIKANAYKGIDFEGMNVVRVSVNFDRSEGLFREIVGRDGLNEKEQFFAGDNAAVLRHNFGLNEGFKSLLIGPNGRIVAVNPEVSFLRKIVSQKKAA